MIQQKKTKSNKINASLFVLSFNIKYPDFVTYRQADIQHSDIRTDLNVENLRKDQSK